MTVLMYSDRMMPFESQNAEAVQSLHARECSQDWMMMCAPNRRRFKCLGEVSEGGAMVYLKSTLTDVDFITSKKKKKIIYFGIMPRTLSFIYVIPVMLVHSFAYVHIDKIYYV